MEKWSSKLTASGYPARWNPKGVFVIYTAASRALACLENIVHRSGEGLNHIFKVMLIEIPDNLAYEEIRLNRLPADWHTYESYSTCQKIGTDWVAQNKTAILKVPSSIIRNEHNFLINPNHSNFAKIKLEATETFEFDPRFKNT